MWKLAEGTSPAAYYIGHAAYFVAIAILAIAVGIAVFQLIKHRKSDAAQSLEGPVRAFDSAASPAE